MAELILGQAVSLSGEAVDKLISRADGDAALLCLALLRRNEREDARRALGWEQERLERAWLELARMGLVSGCLPEMPPLPEQETPPEYMRGDVMRALETEPTFRSLYQAVERRLGKKLSDTDLKMLYEVYDFLALPAEVIVLLVTRCMEEVREKYGPGRIPRMTQIKKTAYAWRRLGIDTMESAEEYLKRQSHLRTRERELLPLLDIVGRPAVTREREYLDAWIGMGFPDETIRLAYERTVLKKQSLNWPYMNSILKSWHSKGLHTVAEVQAGDGMARKSQTELPAQTIRAANDRLRRDMELLERLAHEQGR